MDLNRRFSALMASVAVVAALLAASCAGGPAQAGSSSYYKLVDYKGKAEGAAPPAWASLDSHELEATPEFRGLAVFKFEESGKDLESLRRWTAMFSAPSELSSRISNRVKETFEGLEQGDKDRLSTYFREVVESISETEFSGYQKYDEWWALKLFGQAAGPKAGTKEYTYSSLYVLPKSALKKYIAAAEDKAAQTAKLPADAAKNLERSERALSEGFGGW
jgi:hypothetical protein